MCGICGFVRFRSRATGEESRIIEKMNRVLFHRGPDAQDTVLLGNAAFGFSRLSIIGLSNGMQPIYNEDGTMMLICNGEIFNYIELREQLVKSGHVFKTLSDVEVILHLYEEKGVGFLNELNGQFAFALYDLKNKILFCARDQMGIIPFYYTMAQGSFIFGSEIKAILQHPFLSRRVDLVGLDQVFTFPGLLSPRTMFKDIFSLENGHYLIVDNEGNVQKKEYWDLVYPEGGVAMNGKTETDYIDQLEQLLDHSIRLRLRADVPFGLYLSGGLDSSVIAMKAHRFNPRVLKEGFSIDFIDSDLSESVYQQLIARESNSVLNQTVFFYDDISKRLPSAIYHCECPLKETYNTASMSLSEAVRQKGIKVILSGEGSDELFAGYVGYRFDKMRALGNGQDFCHPIEKKLREKIWGDGSFFYERNFLDFEETKKQLYSHEVNACFDEINCLNHPVINKSRIANRDILSKRSYVDFKARLVDHLVSDHGDRMALANSVEVRYPFLDKDLVEFSTQIPSDLKLKDFTEKYILKKMAGRFVTKSIVEREKFGFVAPGSPYLIRKNVEYINDILSHSRIKRQGYFNPDHVESLRKLYKQNGFSINSTFESDLLITVITFGIFLDTFFD